ncbi:MAG: PRD domain-containing protein, partial [Anaerotignaceae bacterium]
AKTTLIIKNSLEKIQSMIKMELHEDSLSYIRLLMHLKFMIVRVKAGEKVTLDISDYASSNFSNSFEIAQAVCLYLSKEINKPFSNLEVGYLAIHIERIRSLDGE